MKLNSIIFQQLLILKDIVQEGNAKHFHFLIPASQMWVFTFSTNYFFFNSLIYKMQVDVFK